MKKIFYSIFILLCSFSAQAQFGTITFNQDTVVVMRKLKLLSVHPGTTTDSVITHKTNGNLGRISVNQILGGFVEIDPTVSAYAKGLSGFSVIKSSTDLLYKNINYTPDTTFYRTTANSLTLSQLQTKLNVKENAVSPGTALQYYRGDKTFQTLNTTVVPEGDNLYATNARTLNYLLSGYTAGTATVLTSSDTFLSAFKNLQAQIIANANTFAVNTATVGLSKATLNATYPNTGVGFRVMCPSILLGGAIYIRTTTGATGTWQTISAPPTL